MTRQRSTVVLYGLHWCREEIVNRWNRLRNRQDNIRLNLGGVGYRGRIGAEQHIPDLAIQASERRTWFMHRPKQLLVVPRGFVRSEFSLVDGPQRITEPVDAIHYGRSSGPPGGIERASAGDVRRPRAGVAATREAVATTTAAFPTVLTFFVGQGGNG